MAHRASRKTDANRASEERRAEDLAAAERKLAKFQKLYTSYRKDDNGQIKNLAPPVLEFGGGSGLSPGGRGRMSEGGPPAPRRYSPSALVRNSWQTPQVQQHAGGGTVDSAGTSQLPQLQSLVTELDVKDRTVVDLQRQVATLQRQLHVQEAREDEGRAALQRQIQHLEDKLAETTEQLHRLEAERWEVLEAVSTVAAGSVQLDRDQRDLERARLALEDKQRELEDKQREVAGDRLSLDDFSSLAAHFTELDVAITRSHTAVQRRALLLAGRDPDEQDAGSAGLRGALADGSTPGTSIGGAGADDATVEEPADPSQDPCLSYLRSVSEVLAESRIYIAGNARTERQLQQMSPAPLVRQLQRQAAGLSRALVLLASEAEADAARLALVRAQGRERESRLVEALQENRRLAGMVGSSEQVELLSAELQKQRQEYDALQGRMRSMRKKLKAAFEDMAAQNKDLREKLAQAKAESSSFREELDTEMQRLKDELSRSDEQLQRQRQAEEELREELHKARRLASASAERVEALQEDLNAARPRAVQLQRAEEDLDAAEARLDAAKRRVAELEAELRAEREGAARVAASHEAQLASLRSEVKLQLQLVVDAYSEELRALQGQLALMEKAQREVAASGAVANLRGAAGLGPAAKAGSQAGAPGSGVVEASRAEAWRMAYEEVQEVAQSAENQLEAANVENARLQAQLQRLTAAAVARALDSSIDVEPQNHLPPAAATATQQRLRVVGGGAGAGAGLGLGLGGAGTSLRGCSLQQLLRRPTAALYEPTDASTVGSSALSDAASLEVPDFMPVGPSAAPPPTAWTERVSPLKPAGITAAAPSPSAMMRAAAPSVRSIAVETEHSAPQTARPPSASSGEAAGTDQASGSGDRVARRADAAASAAGRPMQRQQGAQTEPDMVAAAAQRPPPPERESVTRPTAGERRQRAVVPVLSPARAAGAGAGGSQRYSHTGESAASDDTDVPTDNDSSPQPGDGGDEGFDEAAQRRPTGRARSRDRDRQYPCSPQADRPSGKRGRSRTPRQFHGRGEVSRGGRAPGRAYGNVSDDEDRRGRPPPSPARASGAAGHDRRRHSAGSVRGAADETPQPQRGREPVGPSRGTRHGHGRSWDGEAGSQQISEAALVSSVEEGSRGWSAAPTSDLGGGASSGSPGRSPSGQDPVPRSSRLRTGAPAPAGTSAAASRRSTGVGGDRSFAGVRDASVQENASEGTNSGVDTTSLHHHVASLQEQLAALTHQNSVITSQVIQIRQRQEAAQIEQQDRRGRDNLSPSPLRSPHEAVREPSPFRASSPRADPPIRQDYSPLPAHSAPQRSPYMPLAPGGSPVNATSSSGVGAGVAASGSARATDSPARRAYTDPSAAWAHPGAVASGPAGSGTLHSSLEVELYRRGTLGQPPVSGIRLTHGPEEPVASHLAGLSPQRGGSAAGGPAAATGATSPSSGSPYYTTADRAADMAAAYEQQTRRERLEAARRELLGQPPPSPMSQPMAAPQLSPGHQQLRQGVQGPAQHFPPPPPLPPLQHREPAQGDFGAQPRYTPASAFAAHGEAPRGGVHDSGSEVSLRVGLAAPQSQPAPYHQVQQPQAAQQTQQQRHIDSNNNHNNNNEGVADELALLRAQYAQLHARYELQAIRQQELQSALQRLSGGAAASTRGSGTGPGSAWSAVEGLAGGTAVAHPTASADSAVSASGVGSNSWMGYDSTPRAAAAVAAAVPCPRPEESAAGAGAAAAPTATAGPGSKDKSKGLGEVLLGGRIVSAPTNSLTHGLLSTSLPSSRPSSPPPPLGFDEQAQQQATLRRPHSESSQPLQPPPRPQRSPPHPDRRVGSGAGREATGHHGRDVRGAGEGSGFWGSSGQGSVSLGGSVGELAPHELAGQPGEDEEEWGPAGRRAREWGSGVVDEQAPVRPPVRRRAAGSRPERQQQQQQHGAQQQQNQNPEEGHRQQTHGLLQPPQQQHAQQQQHQEQPKSLRLKPPPPPSSERHPPPPQQQQPQQLTQAVEMAAASTAPPPLPLRPDPSPAGSGTPAAPPSPPSPLSASGGGSLATQRSGDLIATTPFFPLGPETSDFLDRATSVEVDFYPDPDLATSAPDGTEPYARRRGAAGGRAPDAGYGDDEDDDEDELHHGTAGYGEEDEEELEGGSASGHTAVRSSSVDTYPGEDEDDDPEDVDPLGEIGEGAEMEDMEEEEEEEEEEDSGLGLGVTDGISSCTVSSFGTETASSASLAGAAPRGRSAAVAAGPGPGPGPGVSPRHTTSSFRPLRRSGSSDGGEPDELAAAVENGYGPVPPPHLLAAPLGGDPYQQPHHRQRGQRQGQHQAHHHQHRHDSRSHQHHQRHHRHHQHALEHEQADPTDAREPAQPPPGPPPPPDPQLQPQPQNQPQQDHNQQQQQQQRRRSGTLDGPRVPPEVLERMALYAGDEGLARPSTAVPSALRGDAADRGPPVPPEVLSYLEQYTGGGEGDVRPSTASPSVLRARAERDVPVPPEVLSYMQQYTGDEGGARPSSAAPSVLAAGRAPSELPVPDLVLHMAAQFQSGGEGVSRPSTAPSSSERRARLTAVQPPPQPNAPAGKGQWAAPPPPQHRQQPLQMAPPAGAPAAHAPNDSATTSSGRPGPASTLPPPAGAASGPSGALQQHQQRRRGAAPLAVTEDTRPTFQRGAVILAGVTQGPNHLSGLVGSSSGCSSRSSTRSVSRTSSQSSMSGFTGSAVHGFDGLQGGAQGGGAWGRPAAAVGASQRSGSGSGSASGSGSGSGKGVEPLYEGEELGAALWRARGSGADPRASGGDGGSGGNGIGNGFGFGYSGLDPGVEAQAEADGEVEDEGEDEGEWGTAEAYTDAADGHEEEEGEEEEEEQMGEGQEGDEGEGEEDNADLRVGQSVSQSHYVGEDPTPDVMAEVAARGDGLFGDPGPGNRAFALGAGDAGATTEEGHAAEEDGEGQGREAVQEEAGSEASESEYISDATLAAAAAAAAAAVAAGGSGPWHQSWGFSQPPDSDSDSDAAPAGGAYPHGGQGFGNGSYGNGIGPGQDSAVGHPGEVAEGDYQNDGDEDEDEEGQQMGTFRLVVGSWLTRPSSAAGGPRGPNR